MVISHHHLIPIPQAHKNNNHYNQEVGKLPGTHGRDRFGRRPWLNEPLHSTGSPDRLFKKPNT